MPNSPFFQKTTDVLPSLKPYYQWEGFHGQEFVSSTNNIFADLQYFINQFEHYELSRDILLPKYDLPDSFQNQNIYLRHLCDVGAKKNIRNLMIKFKIESLLN